MTRVLAVLALVLVWGCTSAEPRVFPDELRPVPSVDGELVSDAREVLEAEGFLVLVVPEDTTPPPDDLDGSPPGTCADGTVVTQDPSDDEEVLRASTVTLYARGCP